MDDKILKFIGLARRAGKLVCGEVNTCSAVRSGKSVLTMIAADASPNSVKRLDDLSHVRSFKMIRLPYTKDVLSQSLGTGLISLCAVTDAGFAREIIRLLSEEIKE